MARHAMFLEGPSNYPRCNFSLLGLHEVESSYMTRAATAAQSLLEIARTSPQPDRINIRRIPLCEYHPPRRLHL